ncbi:MAG: hypothetical protein IMW99_10825 [Firmicutes bacterium]|nr:hypothetical protein [Bacillota bacterium]
MPELPPTNSNTIASAPRTPGRPTPTQAPAQPYSPAQSYSPVQPYSDVDGEIDLFAYLMLLWRGKYVLAGLVVAAAAAALAVSTFLMRPTYEATALYMISGASTANQYSLGPLETYQQIATSPGVLAAAENALRKDPRLTSQRAQPSGATFDFDLGQAVNAQILKDASLLKVTVRGSSPALAQAIALAWQDAFFAKIRALALQDLTARIQAQRDNIAGMRQALAEARQDETLQAGARQAGARQTVGGAAPAASDQAGSRGNSGAATVVQVDSGIADLAVALGSLQQMEKIRRALANGGMSMMNVASPPTADGQPVAPRKMLNAAIAAFLALMVGVAWIFLQEGYRSWQQKQQALPPRG